MSNSYKFRVGNLVRFTHGAFDARMAGEQYTVIDRMPLQGIEFQYRIHHCTGSDDRVVRESQLRACG